MGYAFCTDITSPRSYVLHAGAIDTHIQGIYTMVEKQGGLAYPDGTIGHIVLSRDCQASVLLDRPPKYRHLSLPDAWPLNPPAITNGQAFPTCRVCQLLDHQMQEVIQDICLIVEILERSSHLPNTMGDYQFFGYKRNVVQNGLGFMHTEFNASGAINGCLCLGMILFRSMNIGGIDTISVRTQHDRTMVPFGIVVRNRSVSLSRRNATLLLAVPRLYHGT